jgi:hypothetical protein
MPNERMRLARAQAHYRGARLQAGTAVEWLATLHGVSCVMPGQLHASDLDQALARYRGARAQFNDAERALASVARTLPLEMYP